jgi:LmbE family N-acetylglucosaminyl deacetylase
MNATFGSILVVAAHPDDETLGCGGSLARFAAAGAVVRVLILGEGLTARLGPTPAEAIEELRHDCRAACAVLGAAAPEFHAFPDNRFDTVPLLDIVKTVEAACDASRAELILTHHHGDLNIDHVITHRAVLTATRPSAARRIPQVWAFETPSATEWAFGLAPFAPDTFVDIGATLEAKVRAMACYRSESCPPPHPRATASLRALATVRGAASGCLAAEAFMAVRNLI